MTEAIEDALEPLFQVNRTLGWFRLVVLLVPSLAGLWMDFQEASRGVALLWLVAATLIYSFLMIGTHDTSHATLLDLGDTEQAVGCALSWPIAWPYLTYRNLYMLHHRMNGMDVRDPERREPTAEEEAKSTPLRRFHFLHPFWVSALGMGGLQLILSMFWFGWKLRDTHSRLIDGMRTDRIGIVVVQAAMFTWAISQGQVLRLILMLVVVERLVGAVMQTSGMIEHHQLWQRNTTYELTQLSTSRNIASGPVVNFLMGGLPHHSLNHAYPSIPYDRLPEATGIAEAELTNHGKPPLPKVGNYAEGLALLL
jgi:fatty acid desaturase